MLNDSHRYVILSMLAQRCSKITEVVQLEYRSKELLFCVATAVAQSGFVKNAAITAFQKRAQIISKNLTNGTPPSYCSEFQMFVVEYSDPRSMR